MEEASHNFIDELSKISLEISRATVILKQQIQEDVKQNHDNVDLMDLVQKLKDLPSRIKRLEDQCEDICKRRDVLVGEVASLMSENVNVIQSLQSRSQITFPSRQNEEFSSGRELLRELSSHELV